MTAPTVGLGLKAQHWAEAQAAVAPGLWFEVHAENYMVAGGPLLHALDRVRRDKPLAVHGVGLSLAADAPPDADHLRALKRLVDRVEPFLVSEHLAWSSWRGVFRPDLLPFPRTRDALDRIAASMGRLQDALGRRVLIENNSLYLALRGHELGEPEFLSELVRRTGCGLLLDVNNVHVSATNLKYDPVAYLAALPAEAIGEVHIAGHTPDHRFGAALLIDTHSAKVSEPVLALYATLINRIGERPTLLERDGEVPDFAELMAERASILAVQRLALAEAAA